MTIRSLPFLVRLQRAHLVVSMLRYLSLRTVQVIDRHINFQYPVGKTKIDIRLAPRVIVRIWSREMEPVNRHNLRTPGSVFACPTSRAKIGYLHRTKPVSKMLSAPQI